MPNLWLQISSGSFRFKIFKVQHFIELAVGYIQLLYISVHPLKY